MRFDFGKNWISYSHKALNAEKIAQAREAFKLLLDLVLLSDKTYLDIGFGQGLDLMLAAESGAIAVGLDVDHNNLQALQETAAFFPNTKTPPVFVASILDLAALYAHFDRNTKFDVVYSWGVLHHTGDMWKAVKNACSLVRPNGILVISIYNKHWSSGLWKVIKYFYNISPSFIQRIFVGLFYPVIFIAKFLITKKNPFNKERGMDFYHDVIDWVGGYPYQYATQQQIVDFAANEGFALRKFIPASVPTGCNQFVFQKTRLVKK